MAKRKARGGSSYDKEQSAEAGRRAKKANLSVPKVNQANVVSTYEHKLSISASPYRERHRSKR